MSDAELGLSQEDTLFNRSRSASTRHFLSPFAPSYAAIVPAVLVSDFLSIVFASLGAGLGRQLLFYGRAVRVQESLSLALLVAALVLPLLHLTGQYRVKELLSGWTSPIAVAWAWTSVFLFLFMIALGLQVGPVLSLQCIALFFSSGIFILIGERLVWQTRFAQAAINVTVGSRKVALIGRPAVIEQSAIEKDLGRAGIVITKKFPLIGNIGADLRSIFCSLRGSDLSEVLIVGGWVEWLYMHRNLKILDAAPFPVRFLPEANLAGLVARPMSYLGAFPAFELKRAPRSKLDIILKRLFDLLLSSVALVVLSPLMVGVALAIRLESPGPILFRQTRNGFNGRAFQVYKFRSMHVLEDGSTIRQAMRADPRVTRVGRFLRRRSIDEIPQFLNVLKGEMSVIGPRPHAIAHDNHYDVRIATYALRQHVKPGITGWAQVNGCRGETRSIEAMEKRVSFDLWYVANWSLGLDLKIVALTFVCLIMDNNVY